MRVSYTVRLFAAYNENMLLRLSDAYKAPPEELACLDNSLELVVRVVNINDGRNLPIVSECEALKGYVRFVERVRIMKVECEDLTAAMKRAVEECIQEGNTGGFSYVTCIGGDQFAHNGIRFGTREDRLDARSQGRGRGYQR